MRNELLAMSGMMAVATMVAYDLRSEVCVVGGDYLDAPRKNRRRQAAPLALPPQERKEKSSSLKRMLGRKRRA
jgi:hypothetical protein